MRIGLVDVDGHNYPNLVLMKLSTYHKQLGDEVEWYDPLFGKHYDRVYMSKVFSFTPDYEYYVNADEVIKGGTGYQIHLENGREVFEKGEDLPREIEHMYPDYDLYGITDTAYGYLTRGCPRGCSFCHVAAKEGRCSKKVADLSEFWRGQKKVELLDPNTLACPDWKDLLQQLIDSKARINFNQGLDIRVMTDEKAEMLGQIKIDRIHFAWDRWEDKDFIVPKFEEFRKKSKVRYHDLQVYCLCGDRDRRVTEEDIYRVEWLKANGYAPYVMLYNKEHLPKGHELRKFQRYVNNRYVFWSTDGFENYLKGQKT